MNWMRNPGTLKFTLPHMNYVIVETWEDFKLSSATIAQKYFKKTLLLPLYPPDKEKNYQAFLAVTQILNRDKAD